MSKNELVAAQSWLQYANSWLNHFESSALSDPTTLLLDRLKNKLHENDSKSVWDTINDLKRLSDKSDDKESAEIKLQCGLITAEMDDFRDALKLFLDASGKYTNYKHHRAVALWMIGCAQWLLPNKEVDAINSWRTSMKIFEVLRDHSKDKADHEWYEKRCEEMRDALHVAAEKYKIPPLPESVAGRPKDFDSDGNNLKLRSVDENPKLFPTISRNDFSNRDESFSWNRLSTIPIYNSIAAGNFSSSGILAQPVNYLETNQFLVEDVPYRVYSLLREKILNLTNMPGYYILKVFGNSMNMVRPVPIEYNDYVLMRQQATPDNGDIVAAEIFSGGDRDNRATLKRYTTSNGKIFLKPESDDPKYTSRLNPVEYFTKFDEGFHICGVAIAVFKKIQN